MKEEAVEQVKRLRNHPSIVLWCGNNEDVMIAQDLGLKWDPNNVEGPWDDTDIPQLEIYLKIWANVVKDLTPEVPYWPTSPFSFGGKDSNDQTTGDIHQWNGMCFPHTKTRIACSANRNNSSLAYERVTLPTLR